MGKLARMATEMGSDKEWYHGYMSGCYERFFEEGRAGYPKPGQPVRLLEIGCFQGASVRMWREWFPEPAEIWTIDQILRENYGTDEKAYLYGHEWDLPALPESVRYIQGDGYTMEILDQVPADYFDVIIDDGPHTADSQIWCLEHYYPKLRSGGLLFIEDIASPVTASTLREMRRPIFMMDKSGVAGLGSDSRVMVWEKWN